MDSIGKPSVKAGKVSRARKIARMVANGSGIGEAMLKVGYAASTATDHTEWITKYPAYIKERERIANLAIAKGLTYERMIEKVSKGLEAKKVHRIYETGETEILDDNDAQVKWWDRGALLLGIEEQKPEMSVAFNQIIVEFKP